LDACNHRGERCGGVGGGEKVPLGRSRLLLWASKQQEILGTWIWHGICGSRVCRTVRTARRPVLGVNDSGVFQIEGVIWGFGRRRRNGEGFGEEVGGGGGRVGIYC